METVRLWCVWPTVGSRTAEEQNIAPAVLREQITSTAPCFPTSVRRPRTVHNYQSPVTVLQYGDDNTRVTSDRTSESERPVAMPHGGTVRALSRKSMA